jgi:phosphatidylinositol phospholipase C delta
LFPFSSLALLVIATKEMTMSRDAIYLPKLTRAPHEIQQTLETLHDRDGGVIAQRLSKKGILQEKCLFLDVVESRLFYLPTKKEPSRASFSFQDVYKIETVRPDGVVVKSESDSKFPLCIDLRDLSRHVFMFREEGERDLMKETLAYLARRCQTCADQDPRKLRCYDLWLKADENGDRVLRFSEVEDLIFNLNIALPVETVRREFQRVDVDGNGTLSFDEFTHFYDYLTTREELRPIFDAYCDPLLGTIDADGLKRFFREVQGENATDAVVNNMIAAYRDNPKMKNLCYREFNDFLLDSVANSWWTPQALTVFQDMTQPLTHYWIASSHNSFLTGDQLESKSSVEAVKTALLSGCRCIDLEVYDGAGDDPVVWHGYTKAGKIRFSDVLTVIKDNAFKNTPFPLMLCLEMHTGETQTALVASWLRSVLGYSVLTPGDISRLGGWSAISPEQVKYKILIKWKRDPTDPEDYKEDKDPSILAARKKIPAKEGKKREDLIRYSTLGPCAAGKFLSESASALTDPSATMRMCTFSEPYALKGLLADPAVKSQLSQKTRGTLARVYPAAHRKDSSNFNPCPFWEEGIQCVALNYQTWDLWMRLMESRFLFNGRCGYVLKPDFLRDSSIPRPTVRYTLRVSILLGQQLPKPAGSEGEVVDPFVVVDFHGSHADEAVNPTPRRTKTVQNNGFSPFWNETFDFSFTDIDNAFLVVRVVDSSTEEGIGEAIAPISALRLGYRAIPLISVKAPIVLQRAKLFCHFALQADSPPPRTVSGDSAVANQSDAKAAEASSEPSGAGKEPSKPAA